MTKTSERLSADEEIRLRSIVKDTGSFDIMPSTGVYWCRGLLDEIDALRAELETQEKEFYAVVWHQTHEVIAPLAKERDEWKAKSDKYREALEWYANWDWRDNKYVQAVPQRARKALGQE